MSCSSRPVGLFFPCSLLFLLGVIGLGSACGGVAREQHAPPAANAGAAAVVDAGAAAAQDTPDAAAIPDASFDDAAEPCPRDAVVCCDSWTGLRSPATCLDGFTHCGGRLDLLRVDSECRRTADECHVQSRFELNGKACSSAGVSCPFGRGCTLCVCECQESTLLWSCQCNPC